MKIAIERARCTSIEDTGPTIIILANVFLSYKEITLMCVYYNLSTLSILDISYVLAMISEALFVLRGKCHLALKKRKVPENHFEGALQEKNV